MRIRQASIGIVIFLCAFLIIALGLPKFGISIMTIPGNKFYSCKIIKNKPQVVVTSNQSLVKNINVLIKRYKQQVSDLNAKIKKLSKPSQAKVKAKYEKRMKQLKVELAGILSCKNGSLMAVTPVPTNPQATPTPANPQSVCGNGVLEVGEECDTASECCDSSCHALPINATCNLDLTAPLTACEAAGCDGMGHCSIMAKQSACDDGNNCTTNDRCESRSCVGDALEPSDVPVIECGIGECKRVVSVCTGSEICTPGQPIAEVCNGLDDDCNGLIDDGLGVATCGQGACSRTVSVCLNGIAQICEPGEPQTETCNGIDDDCDGQVDEGLGTLSCGQGRCARQVDRCQNGTMEECVPGTPASEICNGVDDDCDGEIDEGLGSVTCGVGACFRTVDKCVNGSVQSCVAGAAQTEVCNGIDDDCDGEVDEGIEPISCGQGACARSVLACVNGVSQTCTPGEPQSEICNGLDDDCDGSVDEGSESSCAAAPGARAYCASGRCAYGCSGGRADANSNTADGCEIDLMRDVNNCGSVGNVCSSSSNEGLCTTNGCVNGSCVAVNKPAGTLCMRNAAGSSQCAEGFLYGRGDFYCDAYGACAGNARISCPGAHCSPLGCLNQCDPYLNYGCGDRDYFTCWVPFVGVSPVCRPY